MDEMYDEVTNDQPATKSKAKGKSSKKPKDCGCNDETDATEAALDQAYEELGESLEEADDDDQGDEVEEIEEGYDLLTHGGGSLEAVPDFRMLEPMLEGIGETEPEPLPEGWATMRDAASVHYGGDVMAESVCGADNRVHITSMSSPPWRMIAKLIITAGDGNRYGGTGWFISPRTVMTAGHCLFSNRSGGWARSIEVVPGMNANLRPFGSASSSTFRSVRGWTQNGDPALDYGCIVLPESARLGSRTGYFGFAKLPSRKLRRLLVNTSGYPGDKSFGTQWYNAGRVTHVRTRRIEYMIDTFGGQSGSPVWKYSRSSGSRHAVGIHNYGGCDNKATRITKGTFDNMKRWKAEGM